MRKHIPHEFITKQLLVLVEVCKDEEIEEDYIYQVVHQCATTQLYDTHGEERFKLMQAMSLLAVKET